MEIIKQLLNLLGIHYEPFTWFDAFFAGSSLLLTLLDIALIVFTRKFKPQIENGYYAFHRKYGVLKITLIKPLIIYSIIYLDSTRDMAVTRLTAAIVLAYGYLIIKLFIDLLKKNKIGTVPVKR